MSLLFPGVFFTLCGQVDLYFLKVVEVGPLWKDICFVLSICFPLVVVSRLSNINQMIHGQCKVFADQLCYGTCKLYHTG